MEIVERELKGVFEITLKPKEDERGYFMRIYDDKLFKNSGLTTKWVQENHSKTIKKGVIRGLHFQLPPFSETKLVRCIAGVIYDIYVDLRKGSSTFGNYGFIKLSQTNRKMVYIPRGFAHGFCTLTDKAEVLYKVDSYYSKEYEIGLIYSDKDLNIKWPVKNPKISDKDKNNMNLKEFIKLYNGVDL